MQLSTIGAEAVLDLLRELDLGQLIAEMREELPTINSETKRKKITKRLKLSLIGITDSAWWVV